MEFARFGGNIPTEYWGCCAASIIQDFNQDPNTPASSQLIEGDSGAAIMQKGELAFVGPTLRDVFESRIRLGEFSSRDMPNHAFLAILTDNQCRGGFGKEWLKILKENGFEYLRTVNNSVWNVNNHIFGLFRNIGPNSIGNQFYPPEAWTSMQTEIPEAWCSDLSNEDKRIDITDKQKKAHKAMWERGKTRIMTESEIVSAGSPVIMGGIRSEFPPELKATRETKLAKRKEQKIPINQSSGMSHNY